MEASILNTIRSLLGVGDDTSFDPELILHINLAISSLNSLAFDLPFAITGETEVWSDYLPAEFEEVLGMVQSFIHLKVKKLFDPTASSVLNGAIDTLISEWEVRLKSFADTYNYTFEEAQV